VGIDNCSFSHSIGLSIQGWWIELYPFGINKKKQRIIFLCMHYRKKN
jgi:hypothetical protein